MDRFRHSDAYDPDPDFDRPTRAEAEADMREDGYREDLGAHPSPNDHGWGVDWQGGGFVTPSHDVAEAMSTILNQSNASHLSLFIGVLVSAHAMRYHRESFLPEEPEFEDDGYMPDYGPDFEDDLPF